jgi:DNA-binding transcriptional ArsR family regulator
MPRLTTPPGLPRGVEIAIDALGNRARIEILRALSRSQSLTLPELAETVGATTVSVLKHLRRLEAHGLVVADEPPGQRQGKHVRWSVVPGALDRAVRVLSDYVSGR